MQKLHTLLIFTAFFAAAAYGQPNLLWSNHFGSELMDTGYDIQQTNDGGYIITGDIGLSSYNLDGDLYLIKTDASGNEIWSRTYGGDEHDCGYSVRETSDGGYIISGVKDEGMYGLYCDVYLIKTDANGDSTWTRSFDFGDIDCGFEVVETDDGCFVVAGVYDGGFTSNIGDMLLMKLDADGNVIWQNTYDNLGRDCAYSMDKTLDGGYILAGATNEDTYGGYGEIYVLKTDGGGNQLWTHNYGYGIAKDIRQTADGGFIICGWSGEIMSSMEDTFILKIDSQGNVQWRKIWGTEYVEMAWSVVETADNGFLMLGGDCLIKFDSQGRITGFNDIPILTHGYNLQMTEEGYFVIAGWTLNPSYGSTDVSIFIIDDQLETVTGEIYPVRVPTQVVPGEDVHVKIAVRNNTESPATVNVELSIKTGIFSYTVLNYRQNVEVQSAEAVICTDYSAQVPGTIFTGETCLKVRLFDSITLDVLMEDIIPVTIIPGENISGIIPDDDHSSSVEFAPEQYKLHPASPNPFNPTTELTYDMKSPGKVSLSIYDISGREISSLVDGWQPAGQHKLTFEAHDLTSGVYFACLTAGDFTQTQKLLLIK